MSGNRVFKCYACGNEWEEPYGTGRPLACPKCRSPNIHRTDADRGKRTAGGGFGAGRAAYDQGRGRDMSGRGQR
ncbi:MAG: hypothetical protein JW880_00735 [Candidatus Thermoplasmatota archaeon]|nr:hypothetical protein [Candidatus Thermoplasmatota archaeon]